jgi:hypothetical protein
MPWIYAILDFFNVRVMEIDLKIIRMLPKKMKGPRDVPHE